MAQRLSRTAKTAVKHGAMCGGDLLYSFVLQQSRVSMGVEIVGNVYVRIYIYLNIYIRAPHTYGTSYHPEPEGGAQISIDQIGGYDHHV